jgi:hypothetical protein
MAKIARWQRSRPRLTNRAPDAPRHRVTQETVDEMAALRRQGLTFRDIGGRLGCSERTARRYAGSVQPHIQVATENPEPDVDPKRLRERLARCFAVMLHTGWKRWGSVTFVAEANRQMLERLSNTDPETLRLLGQDQRLRQRLFEEVVVPLYHDFASYEQWSGTVFDDGLGTLCWRPARERKFVTDPDGDEDLDESDYLG